MHPGTGRRRAARRRVDRGLTRRLTRLAVTTLFIAGCGDAPDAAGSAPAGAAADPPDPAAAPIVVTDGTGRTVRLERPARRVVSMMPSFTEWVIAMGAADRLVARTDYDDHPALDTLPTVGGGLTPSIEWLVSRRPELVVAWPDAPSRSVVARLEALGVPVYTAAAETIDQGLAVAADLGRLLGREAAADSAIAAVRSGLARVRDDVAGRPRPDVLYLIGLDPIMAAGPGTFVDELLAIAGGRNVLEGVGVRWPSLAVEDVVRRAPGIIMVGSTADDPLARLRGRPGWRDVPAVRAGRVHAVDPNDVNRPGPRMHHAAARLAELIHDAEGSRLR